MTISSTNRKAGPYSGNDVAVSFPFAFKVFAAADVLVVFTSASNVESILTLATNYTVALNSNQDTNPGGTVTLLIALATGEKLTLSSAVANLQPVDLTNNGGFYPAVINKALDRATIQIQQLDEKVSRALVWPISAAGATLPAPEASKFIGWNATADSLVNLSGVAVGDAQTVSFSQAGTGAVTRTAQDKMRESVSIADYATLQDAINTGKPVEIVAGTWTVAGGAVCQVNTRIYGDGTLQSAGTNPIITVPAGATGVVIYGIKLIGFRLTNESATADIGINVQESGVTIRNCDIGYFASRGIELSSQVASAFEHQAYIGNNKIHDNGIGINTGAYEYCRIDGNIITANGWNNAKTDFAPLSSSLGAGVYGNCANTPITNNQIVDNTFGIYLIAGSSAPNPDHSIIGFNAINHNGAAGLVLVDLKSYELVIGNTIISNVNQTAAVKYGPTGFTEDIALVNAHGLIFTGNTVGTGSDNKIPIYGHARCRYTNNQFLYGPPTELAAPSAGSPLYDTWGYTVNADNIWRDNWFFAFNRPVLFSGTLRTQISDNIENGLLIDGSEVAPIMAANWTGVSPAYDPVKFWREGGNTVRIVGSMLPSAGAATIAFTLPVGYRPLTGAVDSSAIIDSSGTVGYSRVYTNGDVQVFGKTDGQAVVLNMVFRV